MRRSAAPVLITISLVAIAAGLMAVHAVATGANPIPEFINGLLSGRAMDAIVAYIAFAAAGARAFYSYRRRKPMLWLSIFRIILLASVGVSFQLYYHRVIRMPDAGYIFNFLFALIILTMMIYDLIGIEATRK